MALHEPRSGKYVHLKNGKFKVWNGTENLEYEAVSGNIIRIGYGTNEFNGRTTKTFVIDMIDGDDAYKIDMAGDSVGSTMFAGNLKGIKPGDKIKIHAFADKDNPKMSCVFCDVWDGTTWVRAERHDWSGLDWAIKVDNGNEAIQSHPLFNASGTTVIAPTEDFDPFVEE